VYRTTLTPAIDAHGAQTGRSRSANDVLADLTLTAAASKDVKFRASVEAADEASTTWQAVVSEGGLATTTINLNPSAVQVVDDTNSILFTASTDAATTSWFGVDMSIPLAVAGTNLTNYSKVSFWINPAQATSVEVFISPTSTQTTAYTSNTASSTSGALLASQWNFVDLALADFGGTINAASLFVGVAITQGVAPTIQSYYIDNIRFYNDSINVDISGNIGNSATATPWYLRPAGGSTKATGYYDAVNAKVTLIFDSEISVGEAGVTYEIETNTSGSTNMLVVAATGVTQSLGLKIDLGDAAGGTITAGDIRYYDQGTAPTLPITWIDGGISSPISVTLSTGAGM